MFVGVGGVCFVILIQIKYKHIWTCLPIADLPHHNSLLLCTLQFLTLDGHCLIQA